MQIKKRLLALLLTCILLASSGLTGVAAESQDYPDIAGHWAETSLRRAASNGWINGDGSGLKPDGSLTRAELAAIVRRIFGASQLEDLTGYADVPASAWYAQDIAAARRMQVLFGADLRMRPEDRITREETFCVLARLFGLHDGAAASLAEFSDAAQVSAWALGSVSAMAARGYAAGAAGKLTPKAHITRAAFVTLLDRMIAATASGTYSTDVDGNLLVTAPDTALKNMTVDGDLVLTDGVDSSAMISLENVHVTGNVVLRSCTDKTVARDEATKIDGSFVKNDLSRTGGGYTMENLGVMNRAVYTMFSDGGKDKDGKNIVYMVNTGSPATLLGVRPETGEQVLSIPLSSKDEQGDFASEGAWGVFVHSSGDVYLGAYTTANLYRYAPDTGKLENLGMPPGGSSQLLVMSEDKDGVIWGAQATSSSFYSFDPKTDTFTQYDLGGSAYGQYQVSPDPDSGDLFVSSRSSDGTAHLYRFDPKTGSKTELLSQHYIDTAKTIYDMRLVDGKLFCRTEVDSLLFVLDARTGKQIEFTNRETGEKLKEMPMFGRSVSEKSPVENCVYFFSDKQFYKYQLDTDTVELLNQKNADAYGTALQNFIFVELDDPEYPGWSFVGNNGPLGSFVRYNFDKGALDFSQLDLSGNPTAGHSSIKGNDGKIYIGGDLGSSTGSYDPKTGELQDLPGLRQIDGLGVYENFLFLGRYPNANIAVYDTSKPWDLAANNPHTAFSLGSDAEDESYPMQDRPYNILGIPEEGMVVAASVPKQGFYGSALAFYDMTKTEDNLKVDHTILPDLSITSLAYSGGKLICGTSIRPGINTDAKAKEAELFSYDFETGTYTKYGVVIPGMLAVTAMATAPDGTVWGLANVESQEHTRLFLFDPEAGKITFQKDVSIRNWGANWYGLKLTLAQDGKSMLVTDLYNVGVVPTDFRQTGDLYRIDIATKDVTVLIRDFGLYHVEDDQGNIYGVQGVNVHKYTLQ